MVARSAPNAEVPGVSPVERIILLFKQTAHFMPVNANLNLCQWPDLLVFMYLIDFNISI